MTQKIVKQAIKSLPEKPKKNQKILFEAIGNSIAKEDESLFDTDLFLEMTKSHWGMAEKRNHGKPEIRIYCPLNKSRKIRKTIIDIVSDDKAFLVDSVVAEINKHNLLIDFLLHPIIYVKYDKSGALNDVSDAQKEGYTPQSHIHIHIKDAISDHVLTKLLDGLHKVMGDVRVTNQDWQSMLLRLKDARDELAAAKNTPEPAKEIQKYCAFLDYLYDNNFTLLGYREYEFVNTKGGIQSKTVKGRSLGLLSDERTPAYITEDKEGLPRNLQELRRDLSAVSVSKTNRLSTVHRRVPMDAIAIKTHDEKGNVIGEKLFLGLFTSVTYSRSVSDVPLLREKVDAVVEKSNFKHASHDRKALRHILEKYPRDELFQIGLSELLDICKDILRLQERQRIALFMRRDPFRRYVSALIYIPRDRFGTALREQIGAVLEKQLNGKISSFTTTMDDSLFARVMFVITVDQKNPPQFDPKEIEELLQEVGRTWPERLSSALAQASDDQDDISRLTLKYGQAFPVSYTTEYRAKTALFDIEKIEKTLRTEEVQLDLYQSKNLASNQLRLKIYKPGTPLNLSDVMPILRDMGLLAISELPFEIKPTDDKAVWIHDFLLELPKNGDVIHQKDVKKNFECAFQKIWNKQLESDPLNELIGHLTGRQVNILRTYVRYLKQIRFPFEQPYIEKTLTEHASISRMIVGLFEALHNPKNKTSAKDAKDFRNKISQALENVDSLDQDRILKIMVEVVDATLRTNYFQTDEQNNPKEYLSIKLNSRAIGILPAPKPYREIFVYSPRVEGIHLRGDKIARGGLRWSDRHEDFRTEVLGLMKAQMVKNSVIVPMGSKGGFVVKTETQTREEFREEGIECYKIFIRGLLDISDNQKGNKVIPPKDVVRHDGDDPYLVVAADKGTATFSDIANGLSAEYGFWLGDAFASGGSAGYDHKVMGITARGAWESVKMHFRQLNHDTQSQPFDVTGVGDMGGDVFGNGMLLSKHIRLIGAFNHLHIFCDPDPDTATSYKERKRLFENVMGWDQYDQKKLSKGGRIYSRADKVLTLTPEIQKRFDLKKDKVSPVELMQAILKARTDLLWFGGIGTYIKAEKETHLDVGDKSNDALRINATDVRAKVIAEGANLGVTQLARIEFDQKGGKINADFLDNSGGVDSSDHEVNIKILLSGVMRQKSSNMDIKARNKLLEKMTDTVAKHVLRNNYQQCQAISLVEFQAPEKLNAHEDFIQELEREIDLDRELEGLPSAEEIEFRLRTGKGLTRPELCILLAYAKIGFTQELLASDVPENPDMDGWLDYYFPAELHKDYRAEFRKHRLNREIVATTMANSLINRMGPTFFKTCMRETGANCSEIAKSYLITRDMYDLRSLWKGIESLDNQVPAELQLKAMKEIAALSEHTIRWLLKNGEGDLHIGQNIKLFGDGVVQLRKILGSLSAKKRKEKIDLEIERNSASGLPKDLAKDIAYIPLLKHACDIIQIAHTQKIDIKNVADIYFETGEAFHFDWLRTQASFLSSENPWESEAIEGVLDSLYTSQAELTAHILKATGKKTAKSASRVEIWSQDNAQRTNQLTPLFAQLRRAGTADLAMLIVAEQRLRSLTASS